MMLDRINAFRAANGVPPLADSVPLARAAWWQATDLARNQWLIDSGRYHEGSDGSDIGTRLKRAGYAGRRWLEAVGWGFGGDEAQMLTWWQNSPVHRATLLSTEVTEAGVGYVYAPGSAWGHYWCVDFARPVTEAAQPQYTVNVPVVMGSDALDLLAYMRGDGRAYMVLHPDGGSEKFRTVVLPQSRWLQVKNNQWEQFWFTPDHIWRGVDTSPGGGRYYRQFEDGATGARWCPRYMRVGQRWTSPVSHNVQFYDKSDCRPVDVPWNGRATNSLTLVARHAAMTWNGVTVEDVAELLTHTGETMYFGRGWGLVAWSSAWGSSAIAHVLSASEADNEPERGCFWG